MTKFRLIENDHASQGYIYYDSIDIFVSKVIYSDRSSQCGVEESLGHDRGFRTYKSCLIFLLPVL